MFIFKTCHPIPGASGNGNGEAPVFTKPLTDRHARDGDQVTLECEVKGTPRPQVNWFKGKVEILDSQVRVKVIGFSLFCLCIFCDLGSWVWGWKSTLMIIWIILV